MQKTGHPPPTIPKELTQGGALDTSWLATASHLLKDDPMQMLVRNHHPPVVRQ